MAAMLKWIFDGGEDGSELAEKRGEQRAYPNDPVTDELLGDGGSRQLIDVHVPDARRIATSLTAFAVVDTFAAIP
jgi:hypothetical protein